MRRLLVLVLTFAVAGCATAPQQLPAPVSPPQPPSEETSSLVGLTPQELVGRFGVPALQVREGNSLKLQFRGPRCVMDAYLYPSGGSGALKVTHIDTRLPSGGDIDQAACVFALRNRPI
ncbi:MAG TPA: hypothetical protein VGU01_05005 [Sphingomicrobium sp.]|nr:hypothetical protein [Sphingomicrobium sp.]